MPKELNLTSKQFNMAKTIQPAFVSTIRPDIEECMLKYFNSFWPFTNATLERGTNDEGERPSILPYGIP